MKAARRPIWLALVVTPLLTLAAFFLVCVVCFFINGYNRSGLSWIGSFAFMYLFGVPIGYAAMAVMGWPGIRLLIRLDKLTVGYLCIGAGVVGMASFLILTMLINGNVSLESAGLGQELFLGARCRLAVKADFLCRGGCSGKR